MITQIKEEDIHDEVAKWKNWKTIYNNYFTKRNLNMDKWFEKLHEIIVYFNYE